MEKTYKNYKVTKTLIRTSKRVITAEFLVENEDELKKLVEKDSFEQRSQRYQNLDDNRDYLISVSEKIDIEEVK